MLPVPVSRFPSSQVEIRESSSCPTFLPSHSLSLSPPLLTPAWFPLAWRQSCSDSKPRLFYVIGSLWTNCPFSELVSASWYRSLDVAAVNHKHFLIDEPISSRIQNSLRPEMRRGLFIQLGTDYNCIILGFFFLWLHVLRFSVFVQTKVVPY